MRVAVWRRLTPTSLALGAALLVGGSGALALLGLWTGILPLASLWPGQGTIKANVALGFVLLGASLWLRCRQPTAPAAARISATCAALAAALGAASLLEHLAGWDLGIDQLLVSDPEGIVIGASPGRMAPVAALNLLLLGCALLLIDTGPPRGHAPAPLLVYPVLLLALLTLIGHVHGTAFFHGLTRLTAMRVPVTIQFLLLAVGIVAARPARGPMPLVTSDSAGGLMARRLLWVAVVGPLALSWVATAGKRAGLYDADFASALIVSGNIVTLIVAIALGARQLNRTDEARLNSRAGELAARQALSERDQFLLIAAHEAYRLTRLVEDLLDVSRVQQDQLHFKLETFDLVDLTRKVVARYDLQLARADCAVTLTVPPALIGWWDQQRLDQVLCNLMSNAIKFGAGGPINVSLQQQAQTARLIIEDHGVGIPAHRAEEVFGRFERAVPVQQYGGLGVGLYLVRAIVEALGGGVRIESAVGTGTRVTVTLPCAGPERLPASVPIPVRGIQA
jgi:signal transduction histidine kinase